MLRYCISDSATDPELRSVQRTIDAGVEYVQIREKDRSAKQLLALIAGLDRKRTRLLVNGRMDVALAANADGLHLTAGSPSPEIFRALAQKKFLIAVSCHSTKDVLRAEAEGADFCVLGPIFDTPSKRRYGRPLGLRVLHEAVHVSAIPVFALGGVTEACIPACQRTGAAGIAGIRLFQGNAR